VAGVEKRQASKRQSGKRGVPIEGGLLAKEIHKIAACF
jgi:hypothetical protein